MFTGLIRELAYVKSYHNNVLQIQAEYKPKIGDSIAINGICLTASKIIQDGFCLDISSETVSHSSIQSFKANSKVHIEPAMQLGDRLEGHILQGHIDIIGKIEKMQSSNFNYDIYISFPCEHKALIIPKGSIAIDGISLTINEVFEDMFRLTIIPHTFNNTLFSTYKIGTLVNIETDFFAKYIYHMLDKRNINNIDRKHMSWEDIDSINYQY